MVKPIKINLTTKECEEVFPFTKGKWKPFIMPMINAKDIKPIILGDTEIGKFEFALPNKDLINKSL